MSENEFKTDLKDVIDKHSTTLSPDDLEDAAGNLEALADRWRGTEEVWG